jgi:hypothetical protein
MTYLPLNGLAILLLKYALIDPESTPIALPVSAKTSFIYK